ncbi:MAG: sugar phosphate isomerase/epimerase family protein [Terriglobia bacterium]
MGVKHMALSRRDFLKTSAAWGAGAAALTLPASAPASEPGIAFPKARRDRISVTSWPFRNYIESLTNRYRDPKLPGMDLKDFAAMVAQRFNIHNINPLSWHFKSSSPAYLEGFRKALEQAGSHIVGLGLAGGPFYDPNSSTREAAVADAKRWIDIAVIVGSPSVRPQISESHSLTPDVDRCAHSFGTLAAYGARKNVVVNMENDDPVTQDPFFIAKVIEKVDNPYLCSLPDFGNDAVKGAAFNARALRTMFRHAYNMCHVKGEVKDRQGHTCKVDLPQIFHIAKASHYGGYFSMEYDTDFGDPYAGTKMLIEETLKYLGA